YAEPEINIEVETDCIDEDDFVSDGEKDENIAVSDEDNCAENEAEIESEEIASDFDDEFESDFDFGFEESEEIDDEIVFMNEEDFEFKTSEPAEEIGEPAEDETAEEDVTESVPDETVETAIAENTEDEVASITEESSADIIAEQTELSEKYSDEITEYAASEEKICAEPEVNIEVEPDCIDEDDFGPDENLTVEALKEDKFEEKSSIGCGEDGVEYIRKNEAESDELEENSIPAEDKVSEEAAEEKFRQQTKIADSKKKNRSKKRKKMIKEIIKESVSWVGLIAAALVIALFINLYIARPSIVSGSSMLPTLENGDTVIISKLPYLLGDIEYGDIVVIDRNTSRERTFAVEVRESLKYNALTQSLVKDNEIDEDVFWIKRVVRLPGDVIEFKDGYFIRNGMVVEEDYILTQDVTTYVDSSIVVEEGCVFVMGDNRNGSHDSRFLDEQIEIDHIVGKLISK
ncbi:MAG: signal peptidase I, partial [Clostridia bacterium]|nr:signal peptidase I [Clostridia bacterium]